MLFSPHVALGAASGILFPKFLPLAIVSLITHFFLDTILHWHEETEANYKPGKKTFLRIIIDVPLGLLFVWLAIELYPELKSYIIFGAFMQFLPDLLDMTRYLPDKLKKLFSRYIKFHDSIQNETNKFRGVITQLIVLVLTLAVIIGSQV